MLIEKGVNAWYHVITARVTAPNKNTKNQEEYDMKNTAYKNRRSVRRILTAAMAGVMMMTTVSAVTASADNTDAFETSSLSWIKGSNECAKQRERRKADYRRLLNTDKVIRIKNNGLYHVKNLKIYARMIYGMDTFGQYLLSPWYQLEDTISMNPLESKTIDFYGVNVQFAFSFDITWGTDFPYSGVFWTDSENNTWDAIDIELGGTCRMANIDIKVGDQKVVSERNCAAHSEWKPQ